MVLQFFESIQKLILPDGKKHSDVIITGPYEFSESMLSYFEDSIEQVDQPMSTSSQIPQFSLQHYLSYYGLTDLSFNAKTQHVLLCGSNDPDGYEDEESIFNHNEFDSW